MTARLQVDSSALEAFCRRWKITRLELFGSVLRSDFDPAESDVDLLATFADDAEWPLLDHARMERELEDLVGRSVDLVNRRASSAPTTGSGARRSWRTRSPSMSADRGVSHP